MNGALVTIGLNNRASGGKGLSLQQVYNGALGTAGLSNRNICDL